MKQPQHSTNLAPAGAPVPDRAIEAFRSAYTVHGSKNGYAEAIRAGLAAAFPLINQDALSAQPSPGRQGDARRCAEHCQNGRAEVCLASQHDGVVCPHDSCDIEDGIRHNHLIAARQPVGEPLWCMHILGPDDVHAAPSRAHAEKAAAALNALHAAREEQSEHDPKVEAVVAPWPHSAESHAESVADFIPGWLLPRWQFEAIQTDATPPAQAVNTRQPVGEPFGWWLADENGIGHIARNPGQGVIDVYRARPGCSAMPLYTAPTAQAVDLDKLREMLVGWKNTDYPFSYEGQCAQRALDACVADLQGWLDSQAVGNG